MLGTLGSVSYFSMEVAKLVTQPFCTQEAIVSRLLVIFAGAWPSSQRRGSRKTSAGLDFWLAS